MKKLLVIASLLFLIITAKGQIRLTGFVYDASDGKPLPGAHLLIRNTLTGTFTKKDGSFELELKSDSSCELVISFIGYEKMTQKVNPKITRMIKVELKPLPYLQDEVIIEALRISDQMASTTENIDKIKIKELNLGQDIPILLQQSISVVSTSDAGTGIGYTGIRIRGSDISRINVTLNGIPLNDAESHGVWFVDIPDLASSVNQVQIQRGVGSSTNGSGAFGANIHFLTSELHENPYGDYTLSLGSFNTIKNSFSAGTGLLNGSFSFDFQLSKQHTDGFIDRAFSDLQSAFITGAWYAKKSLLRFTLINGQEKTYQAWNGVPKVRLNNDSAGMKRYFDHWLYTESEYQNMLHSNPRTYNYYTYENETDNYEQTHYQLHFATSLKKNIHFSSAIHYTRGLGYYEQYKAGQKYSKYGLPNPIIGNDTIRKTDLIRQKWLDNHFFGGIWSFNIRHKISNIIFGGSANQYLGDHYGYIIWAKNAVTIPKNYKWYLNTGNKQEFSIFGKISTSLTKKILTYFDLQYRFIHYQISGTHDDLRDLGLAKTYHFVNPKVGFTYKVDEKSQVYVMVGMASREPSRNEFRDADEHYKPLPEHLTDIEAGFEFKSGKLQFNPNLYYMYYKNQLILTGKINDVGSPVMTNVPQSYRTGIELSVIYKINPKIFYEGNIALSSNKILNFTEYVDDWDNGGQLTNYYQKTDLSFSPSLIAAGTLNYLPFKDFKIIFLSKYVSRQYIDNTSNPENSLDAYFVNDLILNYSFDLTQKVKSTVSLKINNLFDHEYESNAWLYKYYFEGKYYSMDGYFPQAGRHYLAGISLTF